MLVVCRVLLGSPNRGVDSVQFKESQMAILVVTSVDLAPGSEGSGALESFMAVFR